MYNFIKKILMVAGLCFMCILSGCGNTDNKKSTALEAGQFFIYYLNNDKTELVTEVYTANSDIENTSQIVDELVLAMSRPVDKSNHITAIPEKIVKLDRKLEHNVLSVYFSDDYNSLNSNEEIMFRAAYVKTMTQIPEIKYVCFYVNNQPLTDVMGNTVGIMLASDFVQDTGTGINSMSWADLSIYYANSDGTKLISEQIRVGYGKNASIERVVIGQLIKGPGEEVHRRTLPDTLTLLSVSTKDGICYADFDASLLNNVMTVSPEVTIYSIVNSLCELSNVNKVQISVNGDSNIMFREVIDLSKVLERNLDIIEINR